MRDHGVYEVSLTTLNVAWRLSSVQKSPAQGESKAYSNAKRGPGASCGGKVRSFEELNFDVWKQNLHGLGR